MVKKSAEPAKKVAGSAAKPAVKTAAKAGATSPPAKPAAKAVATKAAPVKPLAKAAPAKAAPAKAAPAKAGAKSAPPTPTPTKSPVAKTPAARTPASTTPASKAPAAKAAKAKPGTPPAATTKAASSPPTTKDAVNETTPAKKVAKAAEPAPAAELIKRAGPAKKAAAPVVEAPTLPPVKGETKEGIKYTKDFDAKFLTAQHKLLVEARVSLTGQAVRLEDEANSLIDEEMGDVQFDDESGEGDTMVVERERDLFLSARARQDIEEIDAALARLTAGSYGYSVVSFRPIPRERLEAIPWATELTEEKVGGIGRR
ncbi:MAG: hypothetical protein JWM34_1458 [Ilumatobacteraceae bacterium]|nr:hypothetical protein [Ilumatobacteraceae bacterium]